MRLRLLSSSRAVKAFAVLFFFASSSMANSSADAVFDVCASSNRMLSEIAETLEMSGWIAQAEDAVPEFAKRLATATFLQDVLRSGAPELGRDEISRRSKIAFDRRMQAAEFSLNDSFTTARTGALGAETVLLQNDAFALFLTEQQGMLNCQLFGAVAAQLDTLMSNVPKVQRVEMNAYSTMVVADTVPPYDIGAMEGVIRVQIRAIQHDRRALEGFLGEPISADTMLIIQRFSKG